MLHKLLLSVCFLALSIVLKGQTSSTIKGTVRDAISGEPLVGVNLTYGPTSGFTSNGKGQFEQKLVAGNYTLTVSYLGYLPQEITVSVKPDEVKTLNIRLTPSINEMKQVVVSAGKYEQDIKQVTVSMELIKPTQLTNNNSINVDDALNRVSGLVIVKGQANIRSNSGFSYGAGSRVMILYNDMPMLSADANDIKWDYIPQENIEQIEVIKGASSTLFGSSALGGVINIRSTFPTDKPKTNITAFSRLIDQPNAKFRNPYQNGSRLPIATGLSAAHSRKIGNFDFDAGINLLNDAGYRIGESTKRFRINTNTRYRFKDQRFTAGLNANFMRDSSGVFFFWENQESAFFPFPGLDNKQLSIRYNIDPYFTFIQNNNTKHSFRNRIYVTDNRNDAGQSAQGIMYYSELQTQKRFIVKQLVDFVTTFGVVNHINRVNGPLYGERGSINTGAYFQADAKYKRFNFTGGARFERFEIDLAEPIYYPVFRGGLNYQAAKATFLRGSWGQGFRTPSVAEKFVQTVAGPLRIFPNQDLFSENGWNAEIGVKQGLKIGTWEALLDLALFHSKFNNLIEFSFGAYFPEGINLDSAVITDFVGFKALNVTQAVIQGAEFNLLSSNKIGKFNLVYQVGYTFTQPLNVGFGVDENSPDSIRFLKYRYRHLLRADFQFSYRRFSSGANIRANSFMLNIDDAFNALIPGVADFRNQYNEGDLIADFRLGYEISSNLKAAAIIRNAFNAINMPIPGNIGEQRMFVVQLSANF